MKATERRRAKDLLDFLDVVPNSGHYFITLPDKILIELGFKALLGTVPKKLKILIREDNSAGIFYCLGNPVPDGISGEYDGYLTIPAESRIKLKKYLETKKNPVDEYVVQLATGSFR